MTLFFFLARILPLTAQKIIIEFYDAYNSDSFDTVVEGEGEENQDESQDEDKISHKPIGRTEIAIDKVI
jgi:hypothetical protein